jgi:hypothetical protein
MENQVYFKFSIGDRVLTKIGEGKVRQAILKDSDKKSYLINFNWKHEEEFNEEDLEIVFHGDITRLYDAYDEIKNEDDALDFIKNNFTEREFEILLEIPSKLKKYFNDISSIYIDIMYDPECYDRNIKVIMDCRDSKDQMIYNEDRFDKEYWYNAMDETYNIYIPMYW